MSGVVVPRLTDLQQVGRDDGDMFGVHAEVLMPGVPQARDEQRRAHDHGQRQRHLQAREQIEQPRGSLDARVPWTERETAGQADRRSQAEDERGGRAERDRDHEQTPVERRGKRGRRWQKELPHHRSANSHDCQRRHARTDREPRGLEHHLAQEPAASCAERGLDEELASSPEAADEEQAGHVAARDAGAPGWRRPPPGLRLASAGLHQERAPDAGRPE